MLVRHRKPVAVLAGLTTLVALACSAGPATAGEYDVWSCRGPAGEPLPADAWKQETDFAEPGDVSLTDDCATGGPVMLEMTDSGTGTRKARLALDFDLPPGAAVSGYRLNRAIRAAASFGPPYTYVSAVGETTGNMTENWGCASSLAPPYYNCSFLGSAVDPNDPGNEWVRSGLSLDHLSVWVGCISNGCNPPFAPPAAYFALWSSQVTVDDPAGPVIAAVGGTLAGPDPVWGKANLFIEAQDSTSGVASMDLEVDGVPYQSILIDTPGCAEPYRSAQPCPVGAGRVFTVDTTTLGEGVHTATGTVRDAAGNETSFGPVGFTVSNPVPPEPVPDNGDPAVAEPVIGLDSASIWHRPGERVAIGGRLTTQAGVPVVGARLAAGLRHLAAKGSAPVDLPEATTDANGRFRIPVPGPGAREVELSFSPHQGASPTVQSRVLVRSRLALSLRRKPARIRIGRKVRFGGRLLGAGPSARGIPVEIQARVSGRWETVATVRTRGTGNWVWKYRFRYVKRDAVFSFRALVRSTPGWPWPATRTGVRKVRISVGRR